MVFGVINSAGVNGWLKVVSANRRGRGLKMRAETNGMRRRKWRCGGCGKASRSCGWLAARGGGWLALFELKAAINVSRK